MSQLKCLSGEKIAYIAATAAIALAQDLDLDDINILSSFFSAVGDNLGIIAAQQAACSNEPASSTANANH